jgi:guanylate kinase
MKGKCIIFSAPSGSGKSTIVHWLMQEHPELRLAFSVSAASRQPRPGEQDGVDYFFLTPEQFRAHIEAGDFLEYEEVYGGHFYGTLRRQVEEKLERGINVLFDIDVKGGVNIKRHFGQEALSLFIQPPSLEELRRRLEGRGTETPEKIEMRLARAGEEMTYAPRFDRIVVNDDLSRAESETLALITTFLGMSQNIVSHSQKSK